MGIDPLDPKERSIRMSKVCSVGNRSTEGRVEEILAKNNIEGWEKHSKNILGKPDFYFPKNKLAVFVDGCFWHYCPICKRNIPTTRQQFWMDKLENTRKRDNRNQRKLRKQGYHVMRIWEHELKNDKWFARLNRMLDKPAKTL